MSMGSNYSGLDEADDYGLAPDEVEHEVRCNACHGSGMDRDEADCIPCEGFGSVISIVKRASNSASR